MTDLTRDSLLVNPADTDRVGLVRPGSPATTQTATIANLKAWQGNWVAAIYSPGAVVTHSDGLFLCKVARTASNTDNPETDTTGWEKIDFPTGAEIKALYEAEGDTNAFTTALKGKLDGIDANADATPDATTEVKGKVELATRAEAEAGQSDSVVVTPADAQYTHRNFFQEVALANNIVTFTQKDGTTETIDLSAYANHEDDFTGASVSGTTLTLTRRSGSNSLQLALPTSGGSGSSTFLGLTDTPAAFGTGGYVLAVNSAGDGLEFVAQSSGGTEYVAGEGIDISGANVVSGEDATTSNKGIVELSSNAEGIIGTATDKAMTPASTAQAIGTLYSSAALNGTNIRLTRKGGGFTDIALASFVNHTDDITAASISGNILTLTKRDSTTIVITIPSSGGGGSGEDNVQADWNEADTTSDAFILNKPTIPDVTNILDTSSHILAATEIASGTESHTSALITLPQHQRNVRDLDDFTIAVEVEYEVALNPAALVGQTSVHKVQLVDDAETTVLAESADKSVTSSETSMETEVLALPESANAFKVRTLRVSGFATVLNNGKVTSYYKPVLVTGPRGPTGSPGIPGQDGAAGAQGQPGQDGSPGLTGADGEGVPAGGTTGQVLTKDSNTNYDTSWQTAIGGGGNLSTSLDIDGLLFGAIDGEAALTATPSTSSSPLTMINNLVMPLAYPSDVASPEINKLELDLRLDLTALSQTSSSDFFSGTSGNPSTVSWLESARFTCTITDGTSTITVFENIRPIVRWVLNTNVPVVMGLGTHIVSEELEAGDWTLTLVYDPDPAHQFNYGTGSKLLYTAKYFGGGTLAAQVSGEDVSVDASGFDGNLATTDNTVQKVAQRVDDLVLGSGGGGGAGGVAGTGTDIGTQILFQAAAARPTLPSAQTPPVSYGANGWTDLDGWNTAPPSTIPGGQSVWMAYAYVGSADNSYPVSAWNMVETHGAQFVEYAESNDATSGHFPAVAADQFVRWRDGISGNWGPWVAYKIQNPLVWTQNLVVASFWNSADTPFNHNLLENNFDTTKIQEVRFDIERFIALADTDYEPRGSCVMPASQLRLVNSNSNSEEFGRTFRVQFREGGGASVEASQDTLYSADYTNPDGQAFILTFQRPFGDGTSNSCQRIRVHRVARRDVGYRLSVYTR